MTTVRSAFAISAILLCLSSIQTNADSRRGPRLVPPVSPACVSSAFGPRVLPNQPLAGTYHYGIDLPAPVGTPIVAAAPGTVLRVQRTELGGLEMLVQHDGFLGIYSHLSSVMPLLAQGQRTVAAGEKLGEVGMTGLTSGAHLYFAMVLGGKPVDPAPLLGVPNCGSGAPVITVQAPPAQQYRNDGVTINGRQYYQILLPAKQYYQWQPTK